MANVCCTDYYFYGPKEEIQRFWQVLNDLHQRYRFVDMNYAVLQEGFQLDPEPARGHVEDLSDVTDTDTGAEFQLNMEDAWNPYSEVFDYILGKCFPNVSYAYKAFEPGCLICDIYDPENRYFPERILCDGCLGDDDFYEFFESKEAAKSFLEEKFKMSISDIKKAEDEVEEKYEEADMDVNLNVYFFKLV